MRAVTNGDIRNRDILMQYSVGSFYKELSLFLIEEKQQQKALEKLNKQS